MFDELKARFLGLRRKYGRLDRLQERYVEKAGVAFEDLDRLGAEPASRFVDDAPKGLVGLAIIGHGREAKQGESVLDLGAGVEADIADEAVRDFCAHQGFLEGAREEVVAVEDCHLRPTGALPFSSDQRVGETRRLGDRRSRPRWPLSGGSDILGGLWPPSSVRRRRWGRWSGSLRRAGF